MRESTGHQRAPSSQIEAITYRTVQGGKKQIIGGHSRWKAFQLLRSKAENDAERARYSTILANEKLDVTDEQMATYEAAEVAPVVPPGSKMAVEG